MGIVNWAAVVLAAALALAISIVWHGRLFPSGRRLHADRVERGRNRVVTGLLLLLSAAMLGHNFARIGPATLLAKPWLYFMQTGGIAFAFIIPAVWLTHRANRTEPMRRVTDCLYWLVAYLAMGLVFWALG